MTVRWDGWPGAPGFTSFYSNNLLAEPLVSSVKNFFEACKNTIPVPVTINYPSELEVFDEQDGIVSSTIPVTAPAQTVGFPATTFAAPAGVAVTWITGGIVEGHRVRGRIFMVPMAAGYQNDGTLADSVRTGYHTAATALVAANGGDMVVWSRPRQPRLGPPPKPALLGSAHPVLAAAVRDHVAVLRSRA